MFDLVTNDFSKNLISNIILCISDTNIYIYMFFKFSVILKAMLCLVTLFLLQPLSLSILLSPHDEY